MKNFFKEYLDGVIRLLQKIQEEEGPAIHEAAKILTDAIVNGSAFSVLVAPIHPCLYRIWFTGLEG